MRARILIQFGLARAKITLTRIFLIKPYMSQSRCFSSEPVEEIQNQTINLPYKQNALTDKYGRFHSYLRMSLTEKCNLRCRYCMPEDGVTLTQKENLLSLDERKRLISIFSELGISKLRFTGGEPTLSKDLVELIRYANTAHGHTIKSIGMTTNGILLTKALLSNLSDAGLKSINISLDTLQDDKFDHITRRHGGLKRVMANIYTALSFGFKIKINVVLIRHFNDQEVLHFLKFCRDYPIDVRFIELMPFDGNDWNRSSFISYKDIMSLLEQQQIYLKKNFDHFDHNDTTKWYEIIDLRQEYSNDSYQGRVGFISSMTDHFCHSCNRIRITADGNFKVCLFGNESLSLRDCIRKGLTNEDVVNLIRESILTKKKALGGKSNAEEIASEKNRPMILIGG
jgi:cyclic pyranopterin phosphate synthase